MTTQLSTDVAIHQAKDVSAENALYLKEVEVTQVAQSVAKIIQEYICANESLKPDMSATNRYIHIHTASLCLMKHERPQLDDRYLDLIVIEVRDFTEKKSLDNFLPRDN